MKPLKFITISAGLLLLGSGYMTAQATGDPVDLPPDNNQTPIYPDIPVRPNAPSRVRIMCDYGDGYIRLTFPDGIWSATVTVSNGSDEWFGFASVDEPMMETPSFSGEYTIRCIADDGRVFVGTLNY